MDPATIILVLAGIVGFYMAWNIGANDVANAMGTSVGSGALTLQGAIIVAAIFEFGGAMLVGGSVTNTIKDGIVDVAAVGGDPSVFAVGMTCCLLAAALWLNLASARGWPVSTTHSIVGAVMGFGIIAGGFDAVAWSQMGFIAASWVVSPCLGGVIAFALFRILQRYVLEQTHPVKALRYFGPVMVFPIFFVLTLAMLFKGLKPLNLNFSLEASMTGAAGVGIISMMLAFPTFGALAIDGAELRYGDALFRVEKIFMALQIMTACFVAFAHGSNDVANAIGPLAGVFGALRGNVEAAVSVPIWIMLLGGVGIVVGLATYGYKVIGTVGNEITELTPSRGFTAEFAAAVTIVAASKLGLPVSTTHTLIGAVIGVGFARTSGSINKGVIKGIVASWLITVPFTAVLTAMIFFLARYLI